MENEEMGTCKHGKFPLMTGCPQCIAEKKAGETIEISVVDNPPDPACIIDKVTPVETASTTPEEAALADQPEPLSEEARQIITAGRDKMIEAATKTAIALRPGEDMEAHGYFNEAMKALEYAEARVIATVEGVKNATDDLSIIAKLKRAMEEKRREYLDPLKAQAEAIRETYSTLMDPIFRADKITRDKILSYRAEQERQRKEAEEINRMRLEAARKEQKLRGELSESLNLVETKPEQPEHYRTDAATLGTAQIRKWELEDFAIVPDEYKVLNTSLIGKVIRAGGSIPGIRAYTEDILKVTDRR